MISLCGIKHTAANIKRILNEHKYRVFDPNLIKIQECTNPCDKLFFRFTGPLAHQVVNAIFKYDIVPPSISTNVVFCYDKKDKIQVNTKFDGQMNIEYKSLADLATGVKVWCESSSFNSMIVSSPSFSRYIYFVVSPLSILKTDIALAQKLCGMESLDQNSEYNHSFLCLPNQDCIPQVFTSGYTQSHKWTLYTLDPELEERIPDKDVYKSFYSCIDASHIMKKTINDYIVSLPCFQEFKLHFWIPLAEIRHDLEKGIIKADQCFNAVDIFTISSVHNILLTDMTYANEIFKNLSHKWLLDKPVKPMTTKSDLEEHCDVLVKRVKTRAYIGLLFGKVLHECFDLDVY